MTPDSHKVVCRGIDGERKEVDVSELKFRPSVYGIIIKDERILLIPQWDGYDFPGGGVDIGEPLIEAVQREIKEETGFDAAVGELVFAADDRFLHPRSGKGIHSLLFYYLCDITGGELSTEGFSDYEKEFAKMAEWIPLEKIRDIKFINSVDSVALIERALKALS